MLSARWTKRVPRASVLAGEAQRAEPRGEAARAAGTGDCAGGGVSWTPALLCFMNNTLLIFSAVGSAGSSVTDSSLGDFVSFRSHFFDFVLWGPRIGKRIQKAFKESKYACSPALCSWFPPACGRNCPLLAEQLEILIRPLETSA